MNTNFTLRDRDHRAIDLCHAVTIFGMALSAKPKDILELGVGTLPAWTPGWTMGARSRTSGPGSETFMPVFKAEDFDTLDLDAVVAHIRRHV